MHPVLATFDCNSACFREQCSSLISVYECWRKLDLIVEAPCFTADFPPMYSEINAPDANDTEHSVDGLRNNTCATIARYSRLLSVARVRMCS